MRCSTPLPSCAEAWGDELALLAGNWLREALVTLRIRRLHVDADRACSATTSATSSSTTTGWSRRDRDEPEAISTGEVLEIRPSDDWLEPVERHAAAALDMVFAQLLLKVAEEARGLPVHRDLAAKQPPRPGQGA